ncbi:hypothetical protein DOTSEDRAFT_73767 [Dothistroma septosporum NZE10]|uniref:Uncharacterized protein n=1 Tax=Dothistroma septosporum (strain NZE10 / CBS 128990) TaxID=675120 RepID=N1PH39_DOTSN|nr:hypothetical protein DOTSEDRAFT_73767 [Dothistroma septosporum NZE10]
MAGPSQYKQPAAVRNAADLEQGRIRNTSTGLMRPLYTSCAEHHHALERDALPHSPPQDFSQGRPRFLTLNTVPRLPSTPTAYKRASTMDSPFLRLPVEIRLQIYSLLVLPAEAEDLLPSFEKVASSTQDYFDYDKKQPGSSKPVTADLSNPTIHIRTVDPTRYKARFPREPPHRRSGYSVCADRFRARCMQTTYHSINIPRIEQNLGILRTNKQIHNEVAELLYGHYIFDFDTHIEAIIPFLSDLTPFARSCVKDVRIVQRALPYMKEFDKCEWSNALRYITSSHNDIHLRRLELGVVAGRPGQDGWDRIARYSAQDFEVLQQNDNMTWLQYLLEVEGLQEVDVQAVIEHCPPCTSSSAMASFVRFSASVETGFAEFLKSHLLKPTPSRL